MQIYGPSFLHGPQGTNPPHARSATPPNQPLRTSVAGDRLDLSEAGQIAARATEVADLRHDRVAEIRQAIASGTYETEEKLSVAVNRILDEIG
jgi:negative regulator of flagellin synthesis FlgM